MSDCGQRLKWLPACVERFERRLKDRQLTRGHQLPARRRGLAAGGGTATSRTGSEHVYARCLPTVTLRPATNDVASKSGRMGAIRWRQSNDPAVQCACSANLLRVVRAPCGACWALAAVSLVMEGHAGSALAKARFSRLLLPEPGPPSRYETSTKGVVPRDTRTNGRDGVARDSVSPVRSAHRNSTANHMRMWRSRMMPGRLSAP